MQLTDSITKKNEQNQNNIKKISKIKVFSIKKEDFQKQFKQVFYYY